MARPTSAIASALLVGAALGGTELPPPPEDATSLVLHPGERVNDYVLIERVRSLPSTFAPSSALHPVDGKGLEVFGDDYLVPDLLTLDLNTTTPLALPPGENQNATGSVAARPLGLPSPFEAELALNSASSVSAHPMNAS